MTDTKFINGTLANADEVNAALWMRQYIGETVEQYRISATSTNGSVILGGSTYGFAIRNVGTDPVYINLGSNATTNNRKLVKNQEWLFYYDVGATEIHAICGTGDTADVRIMGFR